MAVQAHYNDNDYKNWVRTCLGLQFLKQGIVDYVDTEVSKLHRDILTNICQLVTCNGCTTDDLTRRYRPCPKNVCDKIRDKLQTEHQFGRPEWNNTDSTRWCTDHWEIAKCFMSKGCKMVTSSADTDTAGLLSICINGWFMPCAGQIIHPRRQPPMDDFHKNREARNAILHSGTLSLSDVDRQNYIQDMITLLANYKQPIDLVTRDAIQKLGQLNGGIFITPTDELAALKARLEAIDSSQQDLESKVETVQQEQERVNIRQQHAESKVDAMQQEQGRVDVRQQTVESKVDAIQQEQGRVDVRQQNVENKVDAMQQEQGRVDVRQQDVENKVDAMQQEQGRVDVRQQTVESKVDAIQQEQGRVDVRQQNVENKVDAMQQEQGRVGVRQQTVESKVDAMQQEQKQIDATQRDMYSKVDAIRQEQERVDIRQQGIESKVDAVQQDNERVDAKQQTIESKVDTIKKDHGRVDARQQTIESKLDYIQQEQGRVDARQQNIENKVDAMQQERKRVNISTIENQIKKNGESLVILNDKLVDVQTNSGKDVWEIRELHRSLQEKNASLNESLVNLSSRVEVVEDKVGHQEFQIDEIKEATRNLETKVRVIQEQRTTTNEERALPAEFVSTYVRMQDKDKSMKDIQHYLLEMYKGDLSTIPIAPLLQRIKANIDDVYTELVIRDDLVHNETKQLNLTIDRVENYQDILTNGTEQCKHVFVVGKAGVGKTTWSRKLVRTWCDAMTKTSRNDILSVNETTLLKYDLIFYVELRRAKSDSHILKMIEHQVFQHEPSMMADVKALLENDSSRCLIVLEGLDEWVSHDQSKTKDGLPARDPRWKSTIITTTRSWKLEELQLEPQKIDRAVEITGLHESGRVNLVKNVVAALNVFTKKSKNAEEFYSQCHLPMRECMRVPLLLTIFVCLWYEEGHVDQLLAETYSGLIDLLIKYAEEDAKKGLIKKIRANMHDDTKQSSDEENAWTPSCFTNRRLCGMYYPFLLRLGKIGFNHLFSQTKESSLVFDRQSIKNEINDDELELALNIGILSQTVHRESVLEPEFSLSFLHKTVQEYLAALYMVAQGIESNECLTTYKQYCKTSHNVLEMENIIMFVSGLRPELAGEMSCHIADMEWDMTIYKMLLRCVRQERASSITSRHIYIKHHSLGFLLKHDNVEYTMDTIRYFQIPTGKDTTLRVSGHVDTDMLKRIADIRHVKLTAARFSFEYMKELMLEFSQYLATGRNCERDNNAYLSIRLAADYIEELDIFMYRSSAETVLDLTNCKSLRVLKYERSSVPIRLPVGQLEGVSVQECSMVAQSLLECKSLKSVPYEQSTVPICLLVDHLHHVEIIDYRPSKKSLLDLSTCKCLRKVIYKNCTVPIRLPHVPLEEIEIVNYDPYDESELDLSGCRCLKEVHYTQRIVPIRLPFESLENVEIVNYKRHDTMELDLSECKTLRSVHYKGSIVPIRLPSEHLDEVTICNCKPMEDYLWFVVAMGTAFSAEFRYQSLRNTQLPSDGPKNTVTINFEASIANVDFSGCECLRSVRYEDSTIPIRLPIVSLENLAIVNYCPTDATLLDLSECKTLKTVHYKQFVAPIRVLPEQHRSVHYKHSTVPIRLPSEHLEEVTVLDCKPMKDNIWEIFAHKTFSAEFRYQSPRKTQISSDGLNNAVTINTEPSTANMLDLSGCECLRRVCYKNSTISIRLPSKRLEEVYITNYSIDGETMFDLSGCETLITVHYEQCTVPIRLPSKRLKEVHITDYRPYTELEVDLSKCQSLKNLHYDGSILPIRLPSEHMEQIKMVGYGINYIEQIRPKTSISIEANYQLGPQTEKKLQPDHQDKIVQIERHPGTWVMLDLSGCETLRTVRCDQCTVPIRLPSKRLEEVYITNYSIYYDELMYNELIMDLSGFEKLRTVRFEKCTVSIRLPSLIRLEEVYITKYRVHGESVLDLSGCEALKHVRYDQCTVPIRLPSKRLETVYITDYSVGDESILDLSKCNLLRSVYYKQSTAALCLPSECVEKIDIINYKPRKESVLDLSACKYLKTVNYQQCTLPIRLPHECLERIEINDYRPCDESVLDLSACQCLRTVQCQQSTVPLCLPSEHMEYVATVGFRTSEQSVLNLSGHESLKTICYMGSTVPIQIPLEGLMYVEIFGYRSNCKLDDDRSGCKFTRTKHWRHPAAPICIHMGPVQWVITDSWFGDRVGGRDSFFIRNDDNDG